MTPLGFEIRRLTRLALPLVAAQVGAMTMWVVDVLMLGQVSVEALDAASLGRLWIMGTSIFTMGLLMGIDPIASQAYGAGDRETLVRSGQSGLFMVVLLTPVWAGLLLSTGPALVLLDQPEALAAAAHRYALAQLPAIPFFFAYVVLRHWLQAQGLMKPMMWVTLSANVVNAFANWVLIFGNLGFPALGVTGAGVATGISMVYLFAGLAVAARAVGGERWRWDRQAFDLRPVRRIFVLGLPVGVHLGLEYWAFSLSMVWAGWLGEAPLAAHTIAVAIASLTFMVPLGISFAAVTRVGNLLGAGDSAGAQRASWVALGLSTVMMTATAIGLVVGRWWLPGLFTADPAVLALCAAILPIAGLFQVFDGAQVTGAGVLRGMGKTLPAGLFTLVGFYALALPLSWYLGFEIGMGLVGIWWGLALGLTSVALLTVGYIALRGPKTATGLTPR